MSYARRVTKDIIEKIRFENLSDCEIGQFRLRRDDCETLIEPIKMFFNAKNIFLKQVAQLLVRIDTGVFELIMRMLYQTIKSKFRRFRLILSILSFYEIL